MIGVQIMNGETPPETLLMSFHFLTTTHIEIFLTRR